MEVTNKNGSKLVTIDYNIRVCGIIFYPAVTFRFSPLPPWVLKFDASFSFDLLSIFYATIMYGFSQLNSNYLAATNRKKALVTISNKCERS